MSKITIDEAIPEQSFWETRYVESPDRFIALLAKAFDVSRSETGAQLEYIRSPDFLAKNLYLTSEKLAKLIANDDVNQQSELVFLFEFIHFLFKCFNRFLSFRVHNQIEIYKSFQRDVAFKLLHLGFRKISKSNVKPILNNINDYKSERMLDYLSLMLDLKYIKNSKENSVSWLEFQNNRLGRGVGTEIKRFTSRYKNEKSIKTSGSINSVSTCADDELIVRLNKGYPTSTELRSFLRSSIAVQHIQKCIDFTSPSIFHFQRIAKDLVKVFLQHKSKKQALSIDNNKNNEFSDFCEKIEKVFRKNIAAYLKKIVGGQSYYDVFLRFEKLINEIQAGHIKAALEITQEIINNKKIPISGYVLEVIYKLNAAINIKLNSIKKYTPNDYQSICLKSMEVGGMDFVRNKYEGDAFPFVNNGILISIDSVFLLSSINLYGEGLSDSTVLTLEEKIALMISEPDIVEDFLSEIYSIPGCTDLESIPLLTISKIASKYNKGKSCIRFIKNSNLYKCLAELNSLMSYWPDFITDRLVFTNKFRAESIEEKRKVLLAIDHYQYTLDARLNSDITLETRINNQLEAVFHGDINLDIYYFMELQALASSKMGKTKTDTEKET